MPVSLRELLSHLSQPGTSEIAIASGRAAMARVDGNYLPVDSNPISGSELVQLLAEAGFAGQTLSEKPSQWLHNVAGFGALGVAAVKRGDVIQARLTRVNGSAFRSAPATAPSAPLPLERNLEAVPAARPATQAPALNTGSLEAMVFQARSMKASDVHLIATRPVLFRIAGDLLPQSTPLGADAVERLVNAIVPPSLAPQLAKDGSCDFAVQFPSAGRCRVNVSRQRTGLKACFRLIAAEVPTLASLGLPESLAQATHHHQGLILLTGPSGHGKTSTLAALVDVINRETSHHVISVEDPIEYVYPRRKALISQREVGRHTKSFQSALKGSLREDPDVIVVGELRDTETVRMALSASETGHLLIATMNTPSAAKTIDRMIDLFPTGEQGQVRMSLSVSLRMIVSQRLLPNSKRDGVVAAAELLPGSISLGNLIREEKTYQIPSLQQRGKAMGVVRLDDSLAQLVHEGKTTLETAQEYAESPDALPALVNALKAAASPAPAAPQKPASRFGFPGKVA